LASYVQRANCEAVVLPAMFLFSSPAVQTDVRFPDWLLPCNLRRTAASVLLQRRSS